MGGVDVLAAPVLDSNHTQVRLREYHADAGEQIPRSFKNDLLPAHVQKP